ncbi:MAG: TetR family transcriptional regulator [Hydrocarboniphaga sp.]|uniref:TetR/AcrR family transcriptional regulator n=1 Tax=Hydrocarboniphaga sp. TaxID=2033016 RepID=UPI0026017484|nr:TetR/AcrR family transcriptional regulator [Hydrocarboniphaga sp.]MDB5972826.1 TetR family transcriptional regulator [Hydrocarboniphaga sp.]
MARPRSEDKRSAILAAAVQVMAEQGESAPTAKIAKLAGVAEGTLFTYFSSKDELLNQLYLAIKADMGEVMLSTYPKKASVRTRAEHVWGKYVAWGVANPHKRKVMAQLTMSGRVNEPSKASGSKAFADVQVLLNESMANSSLRELPSNFVGAVMTTLAEVTIDFMTREPADAERYAAAGFSAFWNAITKD